MKSIPSLFRPESATLQSGKCGSAEFGGSRRVRGGTTPGDGKATDSRDTEETTIRRAAEFGEAIFRENPGKASRDRIIAEAVTAHGYSQMEVASFLHSPLFHNQPNPRNQ
jgi:hypothetical protein